MILYNTKTRKKQEFKPIKGDTVRMYSCGPTVYFTAHIGNLRAYIFVDILKKALELDGYKLFDVMNITDVGHLTTDADSGDDKIEKSAKAQGIDPAAIAKKYTDEFLRDCAALNIRRAKIIAPATGYINEMIEFVKGLEKKGYTYQTSDGIYFDASKFADYAALSGASIEGNRGGARVDIGEKRNINDFALWKFCGPNVIQKWPSPWGVGCPGWHIECSTIALKHLGETFDIHTGGIDHIPIHHPNEIAQTESLTGKTMCNFWCHNEFVAVDNGKMGKSLGNAYTLAELNARGYSALAFRYFVLLASYRTLLNFTFESMQAAQNAYNNLIVQLAKHYNTDKGQSENEKLASYFEEFKKEITDDLNTPKAIAILWQMLKEPSSRAIYDIAVKMDKVLSLDLDKNVKLYIEKNSAANALEIPDNIKELADKRIAAKQNKDFKTADSLRAQITELGWEIIDNKDGYVLKQK